MSGRFGVPGRTVTTQKNDVVVLSCVNGNRLNTVDRTGTVYDDVAARGYEGFALTA